MRIPKRDQLEGWLRLLRSLTEALVEVLGAEWSVLSESWKRWLQRMAIVAGLLLCALAGIACTVLLLGALVVSLFHLWTQSWPLALLATIGVVLLFVALLAGGAFLIVRYTETPVASTRRRLGDHLEWWRDRLLDDGLSIEEGGDDGEIDDGGR